MSVHTVDVCLTRLSLACITFKRAFILADTCPGRIMQKLHKPLSRCISGLADELVAKRHDDAMAQCDLLGRKKEKKNVSWKVWALTELTWSKQHPLSVQRPILAARQRSSLHCIRNTRPPLTCTAVLEQFLLKGSPPPQTLRQLKPFHALSTVITPSDTFSWRRLHSVQSCEVPLALLVWSQQASGTILRP